MSPNQVALIPINAGHEEIAQEVHKKLKALGLRVEYMASHDNFGKRIKKAKDEKVPYFIIIGDKDIEANKVTLESRDEGQLGQKSVEEVVSLLSSQA